MPQVEDPENYNEKRYRLRRSIMDYGMGGIILCCGVFFFLAPRLGVAFQVDDTFRYLFAGLCLLYGGFRFTGDIRKTILNKLLKSEQDEMA